MILIFSVSGDLFAQKRQDTFNFFGVGAYSGELLLRGLYRHKEQSGEKITETEQSYYFAGGIMLNANVYLGFNSLTIVFRSSDFCLWIRTSSGSGVSD